MKTEKGTWGETSHFLIYGDYDGTLADIPAELLPHFLGTTTFGIDTIISIKHLPFFYEGNKGEQVWILTEMCTPTSIIPISLTPEELPSFQTTLENIIYTGTFHHFNYFIQAQQDALIQHQIRYHNRKARRSEELIITNINNYNDPVFTHYLKQFYLIPLLTATQQGKTDKKRLKELVSLFDGNIYPEELERLIAILEQPAEKSLTERTYLQFDQLRAVRNADYEKAANVHQKIQAYEH